MKFTNQKNKLPIKSWCEHIEPGALAQAANLANHPMLYKQVALMPDCHEGYGMPIGGVIACQRAIIPNAVGVDIGCGMCACKSSIPVAPRDQLKPVLTLLRERIPVGFNHRGSKVDVTQMPARDDDGPAMPVVDREFESARRQMGTLGGGNHFIELQSDRQGMLWAMIHSGSRNIGKQVADHYNHVAVDIDQHRRSPLPRDWQLAYLEMDTKQARNYVAEMEYCVEFALANRRMMMSVVQDALREALAPDATFEPLINIAHNYVAPESHFGREVWVHRKGATLASPDTVGIIPGSQGTNSYIVHGLGNPESFQSCSHGAGRRMGRKQAQRELNLSEEIERLNSRGILHSVRGKSDLDEAAGAYKDIGEVMASQADLVEVVEELTPLAVIKG